MDPHVDETEYDEDSRFLMHQESRLEAHLDRLVRPKGVLSASIIDATTGDVIRSTLPHDQAMRLAEHVPSLLHRAALCSACIDSGEPSSASGGDTELEMLCISTRKREFLLCGDRTGCSGAVVIVEQDRLLALSETPHDARGEDPSSSYRRLLVGAGMLSPGLFAGDEFDDAE